MLTFFYKYHQKCYSQYPARDDVGSVVNELIPRMLSLNGKQQLYIRRSGDNGSVSYVLYSHVLDDKKGLLGICAVFDDKKFPCNISYLFEFFESQFSNYIRDGRLLNFDSTGNVIADESKMYHHSALIHMYTDRIGNNFNYVKANLVKYPQAYYEIAKSQAIVLDYLSCETSFIQESVKHNNIIIVTKEIERENINSMRSIIKKSNDTVDELNNKIKKLEEQLKKADREKNRSQTNPPKKQVNNTNRNGTDATTWIVLGVIVTIILLNLIAPWFIPSVWPKLAVVLTGFGTYFAFKALANDTDKKIYKTLGWCGAVAILLSTILTIYGICGGFSSVVDESGNIPTVTEYKIVLDGEQENITIESTSVKCIPDNFVHISSGASDFYIDKYEVMQKDYVALMESNPSKYQADSLPVHGMSVRDAVIYCNKKSVKQGYRGFYNVSGNVVMLKDNGNGYRLPTEAEWELAASAPVEEQYSKEEHYNRKNDVYMTRSSYTNAKEDDFKPHEVGEKNRNKRGLYDMFGNVCELCVRDNGEIWGKGGSYRIILDSEIRKDSRFKVADNLSSSQKTNADFGLRLVFIP